MPRKPQSYNNTTPVQQFTETAYDAVVICSDNIEDIIRAAGGADAMALYLGAHPTEPTTGNDGEPLVSGNFFLDTTTSSLKYWDATNTRWVESDVDTIVNAANDAIAARDAAQAAQAASEAAQLASETSATNSANSASASATSASNATTSATNSSNSAAASASSAVDSANSATDAEGHATNASTFATNSANSAAASEASNVSAGTHAANAASSETNAATSAVTASNAAAQAEAAFDNFDDMYLGRKTVPPTTDNDGNPLQVGASYWHDNGDNTGEQRFWNGASWESPELTATQAAQQAIAARDDAQVSETNAANSATASAGSAADALLSEQAASASASSASTLADEAAASEQAAFNSANAAATSETNAGTHATNAANSATAASNSATAAANSATEAANTVATFEWQKFVRGEAELNQMREQNKAPRAASGFDHYGNHYYSATAGNAEPVNEGLWTRQRDDASNICFMNRSEAATPSGTSEVPYALSCIAGFISELYGFNWHSQHVANTIKFPAAPNGTVIYDSVGSARGTSNGVLDLSVDVDPKYNDVAATLNEASARAFEGELRDGNVKGRGNGDHWDLGVNQWTINDGYLEFLADGTGNTSQGNSINNRFSNGDVIELTFTLFDYNGGSIGLHASGTDLSSAVYFNSNGVHSARATVTDGSNVKFFVRGGGNAGQGSKVTNLSMRKITEEVVIDRHDVFAGEYFLEEVTVANPFVYPKGLIQSQLTTMNGITTTTSARPATYYAVYPGDATSVGKGVDFWAASTQQKIDMVSDETNNIFMLSDGRIVQWRMRQKTFAGEGNGHWWNIDPEQPSGNGALRYSSVVTAGVNQGYVLAQGARDFEDAFGDGTINDYYPSNGNTVGDVESYKGVFRNRGRSADTAVNNLCYLHVWGSVRRLNQGAFHPSFNPLGADRWGNDASGNGLIDQGVFWSSAFNATVMRKPNNVADAFQLTNWNSAHNGEPARYGWGYLGQSSGRDDGRFYDAIYPSGDGGVNDDRLPSWDMGSKEESSKVFQKTVNGTFRGEEGVPVTVFVDAIDADGSTSSGIFWDGNTNPIGLTAADCIKGAAVGVVYADGTSAHLGFVAYSLSDQSVRIMNADNEEISVVRSSNKYLITFESNSKVSGHYTMNTVVGNPHQVLATPDFANGWQGDWVPNQNHLGDASNNVFLRRKATNTSAYKRTLSDDNGTSWLVDSSIGIDATLNVIYVGAITNANRVGMVSYEVFAKVTEEDDIAKLLGYSAGIGEVWAHNGYFDASWGNLFLESLLGKVGTNGSSTGLSQSIPLTKYSIHATSDILDTSNSRTQEHGPITLGAPDSGTSPAIKTLWYQSAENQKVRLHFAFNEMKRGAPPTITVTDQSSVSLSQYSLYKFTGAGTLQGHVLQRLGNTNTLDLTNYLVVNGSVYDSGNNNADVAYAVWDGDYWGDNQRIIMLNNTQTYVNNNGATLLAGTARLTKAIGYTKNQARISEQVEGVDL